MLKWLKRVLRNWLLDEDTSVVFQALVDGDIKAVTATDVVGFRIMCNVPTPSGKQILLIGRNEACDKRQFDRIWKQFGGGDLIWEDGSPFDSSN